MTKKAFGCILLVDFILWRLERGGTTRSHPEHGSETPQRRRYWVGNFLGKYATARGFFPKPLEVILLYV